MPTNLPAKASFAHRGAYDDALIARGLIAYVDDLMSLLQRASGWAHILMFGHS